MARHTKVVTITAPGRDKGKTFVVTEMSAWQGVRFSMRALLALSRGGIEVPPGMFEQGWIGLAAMMPYVIVVGLRALHGAQWAEVEPLVNELAECIKFQPPGTGTNPEMQQALFPDPNSQFEEQATYFYLLREVAQLHLGFSLADALSTSEQTPSPTDQGQASA